MGNSSCIVNYLRTNISRHYIFSLSAFNFFWLYEYFMSVSFCLDYVHVVSMYLLAGPVLL